MQSLIDQATLKKTRQLTCQSSVSTMMAMLDELRTLDAEAESGVRKWRSIGCLSFIGLISGVFLLVQDQIIPGGLILIASAVVGVTGMVKASQFGKLDVDNRRYEFVDGVLHYLRRDIGREAELTLEMDLKPHNDRSKFDRKGSVGRWKASFFHDPWLVLRGRFMDGTKFSVSMIEKQQDRHRTKRSASGKLKTKYKTKNGSELIVALRPKPKRYPAIMTLADPEDCTSALPAWAATKSFSVADGLMEFRSTTKAGWHVSKETTGESRQDSVGWVASKLVYMYGLLHTNRG